MKNIIVCFHNVKILNTFLNSFNLLKTFSTDQFKFYLIKDPRKQIDLSEINVSQKLNYEIITDDIYSYYLSRNNFSELAIKYIQSNLCNISLVSSYYVRRELKLDNVFYLDDDTVVLNDISSLIGGKNLAYYMNKPLSYVFKNAKIQMQEFEEYSRITKTNLSNIYEHTDSRIKIAQYNAGHFNLIIDDFYLECLHRFFSSKVIATNFLKNKERGFWDEQRFLTHYFRCRPEQFIHAGNITKNDSLVYLSYDENEFCNLSFEHFKFLFGNKLIIHYVGKLKLPRAAYFLNLANTHKS